MKLGRVEAGVTTTPFITAWRARVAAAGLPVVDASRGVDAAFSLKNKVEIVSIIVLANC